MGNPGGVRGSIDFRGSYDRPPGNGWGSNRGRLSRDEIRMWGLADGSKNWTLNSGAARILNTNSQRGIGNVVLPGDTGVALNFLTGTVQTNGIGFPFTSLINAAGRVRTGATNGSAWAVIQNNTILDNVPGIATGLPEQSCITSTTWTIANGAACTLQANPTTDIASGPLFGTFNSGTLTGNAQGYSSSITVSAGVTLTNRTAYGVDDVVGTSGSSEVITIGNGTVTNQYGFDCPILLYASTLNTPIRIGQGGQTLTAAINSNGLIDVYTGTTTLNFASGTLIPAVNVGGTIAHTSAGSLFGLLNFFEVAPTVTNTVGSAVNFGGITGMFVGPTITANTQTIANVRTTFGMQFAPVTSVVNAGVISAGTLIGFQTAPVIGASTTITLFQAVNIQAPTVNGTLTTCVGIDIAALTGTTAIAVRLAAQANPIQMAMSTTGPTTGNLTSNTNAVLTLYHGATNYYILIAFNDGGTVRYKYLQLNGTGVTWVTGTALPT
jgi:hypothetical protein